ncbi:villin-2 [Iris pallida]|uniref:Villin-2 n=1 Tax=Iris pallida TaxID=29817 RepID=A0AAX6FNJ8_IRIPA|nr:villin-2 [Iris pallida]
MGKESVQDDQVMATQLANTMFNSLKGRPVQACIFQGKEPPQFVALFQPMVILKGGLSSGYKSYITEKGLTDDTYSPDSIALIRVSGTSVYNNKAVQVDAVATSLCSADCFLLQSGNTVFIWHGSSGTFEQQQWAVKIAEFLKPGSALKHAKDGTETSAFWFALGGKQNFTTKKVTQETVRDPHLYTVSIKSGKLEVSEVFNFCQDDLLTEDIMILDTHAEVFVWVGHSVDSNEKQNAFDLGQKYIEFAVALEGLSPDVPLFKVTEGNEPCFFTTYFSWNGAKAAVHGNSFQKKLSQLFGSLLHPESNDKSSHSNHDGPTQRASALAALSSAFNPSTASKEKSFSSSQGEYTQRAEALAALSSAFSSSSREKPAAPKPARSTQGSQRAAAVAALSTVLTAEQKKEQLDNAKGRLSRGSSLDSLVSDDLNPEMLALRWETLWKALSRGIL